MLWFQALQENSDELCQLMYACMIPGFPNPIDNVEWKSKMSRAGAEEIFMSINESGYRDQPPSTSNLHLSSDRESDGWFCSHKIISTLCCRIQCTCLIYGSKCGNLRHSYLKKYNYYYDPDFFLNRTCIFCVTTRSKKHI